ncbi:hypothetical protein AAU61_19560 [Desulfocarbo indianensis]|nr:hypothetical protein AAU61_19560 [Desulfocarbo indianensis]
MEHLIARQAILDAKMRVHAYELLFRSNLENYYNFADGDLASARVASDSFSLFNLAELTGGTRGFINFTRKLLLGGYAEMLPRERVVVEVLESVEPDDEVVEACRRLKQKGYVLALDDFVQQPGYEELISLADIIKVDFLLSPPEEAALFARQFLPQGKKLLAEKVESREQFQMGLEMGYVYFQGYFFQKPVIVTRREVPGVKFHYLKLMAEINRPELDLGAVRDMIATDAPLCYRLLRLVNSAAFGFRSEVRDIKHALTLLGHDELKRWASLLALTEMGQDQPSEVIVCSAVRAKFGETLARACGQADSAPQAFLTGLLSLLDTVLGRPMEEIVSELALTGLVGRALLDGDNDLGHLLGLVMAHEKGQWQDLAELAQGLGLDEARVMEAYVDALTWVMELNLF